VNAIPAFRDRFVAYGARTIPIGPSEKSTERQSPERSRFEKTLDRIAAWRVPHSYFLHFYLASVLSSLLWAEELLRRGPVFGALASRVNTLEDGRSMTLDQVILCWVLMTTQGTRRLWESIALAKPSDSKMWPVHWVLGVAFYIAMGMSIWVEGIRTSFPTSNVR